MLSAGMIDAVKGGCNDVNVCTSLRERIPIFVVSSWSTGQSCIRLYRRLPVWFWDTILSRGSLQLRVPRKPFYIWCKVSSRPEFNSGVSQSISSIALFWICTYYAGLAVNERHKNWIRPSASENWFTVLFLSPWVPFESNHDALTFDRKSRFHSAAPRLGRSYFHHDSSQSAWLKMPLPVTYI